MRDHPRRCGENLFCHSHLLRITGSPPQVRGKPERDCPDKDNPRITPAGAGKTVLCLCYRLSEQDHPRRCGENDAYNGGIAKNTGSPPQVRGKLILIKFNHAVDGITPAGAGKTANVAASALGTWDHPRRCGENNTRRSPCNRQMGSPPQVRGKRLCSLIFAATSRITPAGAGKTRVW